MLHAVRLLQAVRRSLVALAVRRSLVALALVQAPGLGGEEAPGLLGEEAPGILGEDDDDANYGSQRRR